MRLVVEKDQISIKMYAKKNCTAIAKGKILNFIYLATGFLV